MSEKFPIRRVKDIKPAIEQFLSDLSSIKVTISDPWHPFPIYDSSKDSINGFGSTGIYIFSEPNITKTVSLEENDSEIWYIGKTEDNNKSIRGRVWNHLEPMKGGKRTALNNGTPLQAQFTAYEWDSRKEVSQAIRDAIVLGNFLVYGIRLEGLDGSRVGSLESYLINSYKHTNGRKPVFNIKS